MFYTDSHEWISIDGKKGRVGITKYARSELGEIVFVELPKVGLNVQAGEEVSVLESTKAASDVYTPVSGTILAVHEVLNRNLESLNQDPESLGWLYEIELSDPKELDHLSNAEEYRALRG